MAFFLARDDVAAQARFATMWGPFATREEAIEVVRTFASGITYQLFTGAYVESFTVKRPETPALPTTELIAPLPADEDPSPASEPQAS